jgi:hypothetical protein
MALSMRQGSYVPGACNIGPDEIARRRRIGHVGAIVTVALFVVLVALNVPAPVRFLVALPAAGAAAGYLQALFRFCVAFGSRGVFNFGRHGSVIEDPDDEARARDRTRALELSVAIAAVGLGVGAIAVLLPI